MAKRCKRAFTITELVIVIAVVAILAAVLIPTFANVINKANESSDISAVRNMNEALSAQENFDGAPPETASEALLILKEAGLAAEDYSALQDGTAIYYNSNVNRMIYVRLNETGGISEVIYPEDYDLMELQGAFHLLSGRLITDKTWLVSQSEADGKQSDLDALKTQTGDSAPNITENRSYYEGDTLVGAAVADYNGMLSIAEYIETTGNGGEGLTVVLGQDVDMAIDGVAQEWKPISNFAGDFYGRGKTIDNVQIKDASADSLYFSAASANANYSFYGLISVFSGGYFGDVTINVDIDEPGSGAYLDTGYTRNNHTTAGAIGAIYASGSTPIDAVIKNVTVEGSIVGVNRVAGVVGYIGGHSNDSDPSSKLPSGSKVTISNCINNADITSMNRSGGTYSTAAGILSITNQTADNVQITIEGCTNTGDLKGMWVGGIMADAWRSSDQGAAGYQAPANQTVITIKNCINSGTLTGVAPALAPESASTVVVGGIFGNSNAYSVSGEVYKNRYKLVITGNTNSGAIEYELNDDFRGSVFLGNIYSKAQILVKQNVIVAGEEIGDAAMHYVEASGNMASGTIDATQDLTSNPRIYVETGANDFT